MTTLGADRNGWPLILITSDLRETPEYTRRLAEKLATSAEGAAAAIAAADRAEAALKRIEKIERKPWGHWRSTMTKVTPGAMRDIPWPDTPVANSDWAGPPKLEVYNRYHITLAWNRGSSMPAGTRSTLRLIPPAGHSFGSPADTRVTCDQDIPPAAYGCTISWAGCAGVEPAFDTQVYTPVDIPGQDTFDLWITVL